MKKEIIVVCSENHTELKNTPCGQKKRALNAEPGGKRCNHQAINR